MIKQHILTIFAIFFFMQEGMSQTTGMFTDSRDGQTYTTISFTNDSTGNPFTWMAQNLNYKIPGAYPYNDTTRNQKTLGLLYTWQAAMKACPIGWHLATDEEWSMLVNEYGGKEKAAEAMKGASGWDHDGNGTNSSGFNGLPGGQRKPEDDANRLMGLLGYWWTSSPAGDGTAWEWNMHFGGHTSDKPLKSKVFRFPAYVTGALSVRCVKNLPADTSRRE